jgi:hypothetical protein
MMVVEMKIRKVRHNEDDDDDESEEGETRSGCARVL